MALKSISQGSRTHEAELAQQRPFQFFKEGPERASPSPDFLDLFLAYTAKALSPEIFRLWAGISLVAGALEKRCWSSVGDHIIWGNQFIWLVAPPGTGKFVIEEVHALWSETTNPKTGNKAFKVAPTNMTKAALMDVLGTCKQVIVTPKGPPLEYSSLLISAEEIGVFIPAYDMEFIAVLNKIWNCPGEHSETRRTGPVREIKIPFPQLNIIAGVQPGWMAATLPDEVWSTGLARRLLMVYSSEDKEVDLFEHAPDMRGLRKRLLAQLGHLSTLQGEFSYTPAAKAATQAWWGSKCAPVVDHPKLEGYSKTRKHHQLKLALVSAAARGAPHEVGEEDVERSIGWMVQAEALMPDIFRAMRGKSDDQIIDELHMFCIQHHAIQGRKPLNTSLLWNFLRSRVPSEKINKIIEATERSGLIDRMAGGDDFIPRPRFAPPGVL